jgi:hypothetical protein
LAARVIISGPPGSPYTNNTGQVLYQYVCALINTCGFCLSFHLKISTRWPIPQHHGCRCRQIPIYPGREAPHDFADYHGILDEMSSADRATAIGASNDKLLESGLATLDDIVTPYRVRDLHEVVARRGLTVRQMVKAGVALGVARRAISIAFGSDDDEAKRHDRLLLDRLVGPDKSQAQLLAAIEDDDDEDDSAAIVTVGGGALLAALLIAWKPGQKKRKP